MTENAPDVLKSSSEEKALPKITQPPTTLIIPIENSAPELPPSLETIQQPLCPNSVESPTFLRHQWLVGGQQQSATGGGMAHAANFVRKMDSLEVNYPPF